MFDKLERIITLNVTFITNGNLSINAGKSDGIRDNLVIREGGPYNNPMIPGSSIKGMVRSTVEAILAQVGYKVCVPDTCVPGSSSAETRKYFDEHLKDKRKCLSSLCRPSCLACQMFGNMAIAGRVIFHDARSVGHKRIIPTSRPLVAITRDSKTQAKGAFSTMETVPADETFSGDVVLVNPEDWMVGAVINVIEDLLPKLGVGARKTAGYGKLDVTVTLCPPRVFGPRRTEEQTKDHFIAKWTEKLESTPPSEGDNEKKKT